MKGRGMPARALLAGGISRHGYDCDCRYCAPARPTQTVDEPQLEHVGGSWSPAQHTRRAS